MGRVRLGIRQAGPLVTIQDGGRPGFMRFGVPASGPMDRQSHAIANLALGNPADAAAIEISMGGLELDCLEGEISMALAGGGFTVLLNGEPIDNWGVAQLGAGMRLTIRPGHWGNWTYLALAGKLVARDWLGSQATLAICEFGGQKLAAGQEVVIEDAETRPARHGPVTCPIDARPRTKVHVVLGPQDACFHPETLEALTATPFALSNAYDRMGVRLSGPSLAPRSALDIPSAAIVRGSVQVSGDGVATILLADHQTTGGYPKIATVMASDIDGLVQVRPRHAIQFIAITPADATRRARIRHQLAQTYFGHLAGRRA